MISLAVGLTQVTGQYLVCQEIWSVFEGLYFMVFGLLYIVAFHTELSKYTKGVSRDKYALPAVQK